MLWFKLDVDFTDMIVENQISQVFQRFKTVDMLEIVRHERTLA